MSENQGIEQTGQQVPQGQPNGTGQQVQQNSDGNGKPYAQYLERFPEGMRAIADPIFAEWDSNTTKRFQDLQGQLTGYEPYKDVFDSWEPEAVQQGMSIAEQLSTREGALEMYQQLQQIFANDPNAQGNGQQQSNGVPQQQGDDDPFAEVFQNPRFQQIEQGIQKMTEMMQGQQQSEQQRQAEASAAKEWETSLAKNKGMVSNPDGSVNEDAKNMVLSLAISMTNGDIDKAFEMYGKAVGKQASLQNAPGQSAPVVGGGAANKVPSTVTDVANWSSDQRKQAALAMLRANNKQG